MTYSVSAYRASFLAKRNELMTKDFDREVLVRYNLLNLPIVTQLSQKIISTTRYTKTVL